MASLIKSIYQDKQSCHIFVATFVKLKWNSRCQIVCFRTLFSPQRFRVFCGNPKISSFSLSVFFLSFHLYKQTRRLHFCVDKFGSFSELRWKVRDEYFCLRRKKALFTQDESFCLFSFPSISNDFLAIMSLGAVVLRPDRQVCFWSGCSHLAPFDTK